MARNCFLIFFLLAHSTFLFSVCPPGFFAVPGSPFNGGLSPVSTQFSPLVSGGLFSALVNKSSNTISIFSVNEEDGVFTPIAKSPFSSGNAPTSLAFSPLISGNLFATAVNSGDMTVQTYTVNTTTGVLSLAGPPVHNSNSPVSVAYTPDLGTTLFAATVNTSTDSITSYNVDRSTGMFTAMTTMSTGSQPMSLAFTPVLASGLYAVLANFGSNDLYIYQVNQAHGFFVLFGAPVATGAGPVSVAFSPIVSGNLFLAVLNQTANTVSVYLFNQIAGTISLVQTVPLSGTATSVAFSPVLSGTLFAAVTNSANTVSVYTVNQTTGAFTPLAGSPFATGSLPVSVAFSPVVSSNLLVNTANQNSHNTSVFILSYNLEAFIETPSTAICLGNSITLSATIEGGTGPYSVTWSDGHIQTGMPPFTYSVSPTSTTTYSVTSVSDSLGCTGGPSNEITITVDKLTVSVVPSSLTICSGQPLVLTAESPTGAQPFTYAWIGPNGFTADTQTITFANSTVQDAGIYSITITDADGCQGVASANVTIYQSPSITLSSSTLFIVAGGAVTLTATPVSVGLVTLIWSDGFIQSNVTGTTTRTITPTSTTTYSVTAIDMRGCNSDPSTPITITVQPLSAESPLSLAIRLKYCPNTVL